MEIEKKLKRNLLTKSTKPYYYETEKAQKINKKVVENVK